MPTATMAGQGWEVKDLTLQVYSDQFKWRYLLRLRDASGRGLHLTSLTQSFSGIDFRDFHPQLATIDLRIEPNGTLDIPCWQALFFRPGAHQRNFVLPVRKTFSGQDGGGQPVLITLDLSFDPVDPPRRTTRLEFARFTDREISRIPQPHYCETMPAGINVVDRSNAKSIHLLIGTDLVPYNVGLRTRWLSPSGDEVKVIDTIVGTAGTYSGLTLIRHQTHSLPRELFAERPGLWRVELFVDGHPEGVYQIRVM